MVREYKLLAKNYNACKDDLSRLQFLKDNPDKLKAVLDNDATMVNFIFPDDMDSDEQDLLCDISLNDFDDYHYWSDGCLLLFQFAGITAESC